MAATNKAITEQLSAERLAGTFPGDLGVEVVEITDARIRGRMRVDRRQLHPMGSVHGGARVAGAGVSARAPGGQLRVHSDRALTARPRARKQGAPSARESVQTSQTRR